MHRLTSRTWEAQGMATNKVNLDALIPREDLAVGEGVTSGETGDDKISIASIGGSTFFTGPLRKPDFQRETVHWEPKKIVDLVAAFLDRRLIPAVILWRAGNYNFVIDGAHRLSALLAWVWNDYGDGDRSKSLFGVPLPPEQIAIAERTRKLMNKDIGPYALYKAAIEHPQAVEDKIKARVSNLSVVHIIAQWVPAATKEAAEDSFFKINDNATPLEPTERRILQSRGSAAAIAARAIAHGGKGYAYWGTFSDDIQKKITEHAEQISDLLFKPPLASTGSIDTLDVPVAGRGYSYLPFAFDLVNTINSVGVADSTKKVRLKEKLPPDPDGHLTATYLKDVWASLSRITGDKPTSLGLHPVVYFYTAGGNFLPWSFLAWVTIVDEIFAQKKAIKFCQIRSALEDYLWANKWAVSEIVHKNGSGNRSTPWLVRYYKFLIDEFSAGHDAKAIDETIKEHQTWRFLSLKTPVFQLPGNGNAAKFSSATKTATIWKAAFPGAPRCGICGAIWHRNSIHFDHQAAKKDGGSGHPDNAQVAHPYCDSTYKDWKAKYPS
jgi:hypothetical protein